MHILGQVFNKLLLFSSELTPLEDLFLKMFDLGGTGEFASKEQPKYSLGNRFATLYSLGTFGLDFSKRMATVGNTFLGIELGCLVVHPGETTHTTHNGSDRDFSNDSVAVFFLECRDFLLSCCDD
jgi:hypothetical protein